MRSRPYAFLKIGNRWINMIQVTDIEDHEQKLIVYLATDMARRVGTDDPQTVDVARRFTVSEPDEVAKLRRWLKLNDVE